MWHPEKGWSANLRALGPSSCRRETQPGSPNGWLLRLLLAVFKAALVLIFRWFSGKSSDHDLCPYWFLDS